MLHQITDRPGAIRSALFEIPRDGYVIRCGFDREQLRQAYALRAEVFCRELRWVGTPEQAYESDGFDAATMQLGRR